MFEQDIGGIKEMLETSIQTTKYVPILLVARFANVDDLSTKTAFAMLDTWSKELRTLLKENEAGYSINIGNTLVLIEKERVDSFLDSIKKFTVFILPERNILKTDCMTNNEKFIQLFLDYA